MKHKPHIHDYCFFKPHKRMDSSYVVNENTQDFFLQLGLTLQEKRQKEDCQKKLKTNFPDEPPSH